MNNCVADYDEVHVGSFGIAAQTFAGECLREFLVATDMIVVNSFAPTGPTFFGMQQHAKSKVDWIIVTKKTSLPDLLLQ